MKKRLLALFMVVLLLSCIPLQAFAYKTNGYKIKSYITFYAQNSLGSITKDHIRQSLNQWNSKAGKTIMTLASGTHSKTNYPSRDSQNCIYKLNMGTSSYVGQTAIWATAGNVIESDMVFNMYFAFANSAQPGAYDSYTLYLHESGHTAGLADLYSSSDSKAVMYGYSSTNSLKRSLTSDDINGIYNIYRNPTGYSDIDIPENDKPVLIINSTLVEKDVEDLAVESTLIIRGKVVGASETFQILPANSDDETEGQPMNFTDYYIEPSEVFRGSTDQQVITIRVQGGSTESLDVIAESEPEFIEGNEYLLFLTSPKMGSGYNTLGDYYYVCGAEQGAFIKSPARTGVVQYTSASDEVLVENQFEQYISELNQVHPVDNDSFRNTCIENLKLSLKYEFITDEEYENFLNELDVYATIVK